MNQEALNQNNNTDPRHNPKLKTKDPNLAIKVGPSGAFEGSLMTRKKKWRKQIKDIDPKALNKQTKQTQTQTQTPRQTNGTA